MDLVVRQLASPPGTQPVEIVERKGLGHPDTICDALAEHFCVRLCRHYRERFGVILHHNVDKVLLCAGAARPAFGGGEIVEPFEIHLAGRATREYRGQRIPVEEIAEEACREWLRAHLPEVDVARHVRIVPRLRPGSPDLTRLFERTGEAPDIANGPHGPLANDTSCGAGFAPPTDLERVVLDVERALQDAEAKRDHPEIGNDVKVMGVRRGARIQLTIGCAFVGRHLRDLEDYVRAKEHARELALAAARRATRLEVDAILNRADDVDRGDVYLTVIGTSAEAGDDGEVGRGNRTSGLITPCRPMTIEAAAGKNPISHVGKLYSLVAGRVAAALAATVPKVGDATCLMVSQIGRPVDDPQLVDVQLALAEPFDPAIRRVVEELLRSELGRLDLLREALLAETISVY